MTREEEATVNYIIRLKGDCCEANRCKTCPFITECASHMMKDYKEPSADAKALRVRKALNILTTKVIVGEEQ